MGGNQIFKFNYFFCIFRALMKCPISIGNIDRLGSRCDTKKCLLA